MAIKTRQTTATGVTNNNAPLTNAELDNNFVELQQNKVDASGDTMTGNLSFGDDDKAIFGAGSDLQIYHDGDNSYISEVGTGDLYVRGSNFYITKPDGSLYFSGSNSTGEAGVYFNNSRKLATTTDGVDITGEVKADKFTNDEALPDVRPSLMLDFQNSKQLDPRVSFSRQSLGTYYDGKTTSKADENLWRYSGDVGKLSPWTNSGVTATAGEAPTGSSSDGSTLTADSGHSGNKYTFQMFNKVFSTVISHSIYLKAGNNNYADVQFIGSGVAWRHSVTVDLSNGTVVDDWQYGNIGKGVVTVENTGNGWYRVKQENYPHTGVSGADCYVILSISNGANPSRNSSGYPQFTGGGETILAYGAQLEGRESCTSYTHADGYSVVKYQPKLMTAGVDEARFHHDPVTSKSQGLLIEKSSTNLLRNSVPQDTDYVSGADGGWNDYYGFYAHPNRAIAPDGTLTASELTSVAAFGTTGATAYSSSPLTASASVKHTFSAYVKLATVFPITSYIVLSIGSNGNAASNYSARFDLTNGTINDINTADSATIEDVGNGWYRCSVTDTLTSGQNIYCQLGTYGNSGVGKSFLAWGTQLEIGDYPTSYIPTSGTATTRATDQAFLPITEQGGDWYNHDEHTIIAHFEQLYTTGGDDVVWYASNTSEQIYQHRNSQRMYYYNNYNLTTSQENAMVPRTELKVAAAFDDNAGSAVQMVNGGVANTDTSFNNGMRPDYISLHGLPKHWRKFTVYNKKLTNAQLTALTEED